MDFYSICRVYSIRSHNLSKIAFFGNMEFFFSDVIQKVKLSYSIFSIRCFKAFFY